MKKWTCACLMIFLLFTSAQAIVKPKTVMERLAGTEWFCVQGGTHAHFYRFHEDGTCTISWHDWNQWDENEFWKSYEEPFIGVMDGIEQKPYLPEDKSTRQTVQWSVLRNDAVPGTFWDNPVYILELTYPDGSTQQQGLNIGRTTMTLTTIGSGGAYRLMEDGEAVTGKGLEGTMEELLSLLDAPEFDGYKVFRTDQQTGHGKPGGVAVFILETETDSGCAYELLIAERNTYGYEIRARSARALSAAYCDPSLIVADDHRIELEFPDGVKLVFDDEKDDWTLKCARLSNGTVLQRSDTYGYDLTEENGDSASWITHPLILPYPGSMRGMQFDLTMLPQTAEQVWARNTILPLTPYGNVDCEYLEPAGNKSLPVYAAPDLKAYRGANSKASVSLKDELWVLDWVGDYLMIYYKTDAFAGRIGYVYADRQLTSAMKKAQLGKDLFDSPIYDRGRMPMKVTTDTTITDDPWGSKRVLAQLPEGAEVICLCSWDSAYAYVETCIEEKFACGFVPMDALTVEQPLVDQQVTQVLAGTSWLSSYGSSNTLGKSVVFEVNGRITAESFGESCTWKVTEYDPQWGLFWNDPDNMLILNKDDGSMECYGLSLGKGYLRLSTSDGSGGYGQEHQGSVQVKESSIIHPDPPEANMDNLSGQKLLVGNGDYSPETKEITLSLWVPEVFSAEKIETLEIGDVIVVEGRECRVQALLIDDDSCVINELSWLEDEAVYMQKEDNKYYPLHYHDRVWQCIGEGSFRFAKKAVFLDGIDPDTGRRLEKTTKHTIDEFLKMKKYAEEIEHDRFFIRNMWATFNEHDEITVLERQYVPWQ